MNKKILFGSIFVLSLILLMPSIPAIQIKTIEDKAYGDFIKEPVADLDCDGCIYTNEVEQGDIITDTIYIENVGEPLSELNWEISEYPDWCIWTFDPSYGYGLTPEQGYITVIIEAIVQELPEEEVWDEIKIVNIDNPDDYCIVYVHYDPDSVPVVEEIKTLDDDIRLPNLYALIVSILNWRMNNIGKISDIAVTVIDEWNIKINHPILLLISFIMYGRLGFRMDIWSRISDRLNLGWTMDFSIFEDY